MKKKKNKAVKRTIIILIILIILCLGALLILEKNKTRKKENNENSEKVNKNQLAVKINARLDFENYISTNPGIENPDNNNYDVIVMIYIDGKSDPIYKSNKISPGETIDKVRINNNINKGIYNAIAYFNAYDKNNNYKGKSGVQIKLNIE